MAVLTATSALSVTWKTRCTIGDNSHSQTLATCNCSCQTIDIQLFKTNNFAKVVSWEQCDHKLILKSDAVTITPPGHAPTHRATAVDESISHRTSVQVVVASDVEAACSFKETAVKEPQRGLRVNHLETLVDQRTQFLRPSLPTTTNQCSLSFHLVSSSHRRRCCCCCYDSSFNSVANIHTQ